MPKSGQPDSCSITEKNHCVTNLSNLRVVKVWNDACLLTNNMIANTKRKAFMISAVSDEIRYGHRFWIEKIML
jgi:hypothetical protein